MKLSRFLTLVLGALLLVAFTGSHELLAQKEEEDKCDKLCAKLGGHCNPQGKCVGVGSSPVTICHITDENEDSKASAEGHVITVAQAALNAHLELHGDCEKFSQKKGSDSCFCDIQKPGKCDPKICKKLGGICKGDVCLKQKEDPKQPEEKG